VPQSQLGLPDVHNLADHVKEGQAIELKVLEVDPIHHRIVLAATGFPAEEPGSVAPPAPAAPAAEASAAGPESASDAEETPSAEATDAADAAGDEPQFPEESPGD